MATKKQATNKPKQDNSRDLQGTFGESLTDVLLAQEQILFRVHKIAGKWPTIDLYVEVADEQYPGMFCFFQVKSTKRGRSTKNRLLVQVTKQAMRRLSAYNGPAYVIGVEFNEQLPYLSPAYAVAVQGNNPPGITSMSVANQLTAATTLALRDEVVRFWQQCNLTPHKTAFQSVFPA